VNFLKRAIDRYPECNFRFATQLRNPRARREADARADEPDFYHAHRLVRVSNMRGEYNRKPNATHVFVHIAKNGGGSAYEFFRDCGGVQVPFGAHKMSVAMILAVNRSAIVALRDPADRVISEYQWSSLDLGKDYDDHVHRSHIRPLGDTAPQGVVWNHSLLPALLAHARVHLKPQASYTGGASLDDPRVTVLCTERLSSGLEQVSQRLCGPPTSQRVPTASMTMNTSSRNASRTSYTRAVPWLHRTQAPDDGMHCKALPS
jgi:hypothetical protein